MLSFPVSIAPVIAIYKIKDSRVFSWGGNSSLHEDITQDITQDIIEQQSILADIQYTNYDKTKWKELETGLPLWL